MSLLKAAAVQLGTSNTASQNFVLSQNVDGTCKLARGNLGATTQDILTVSAGGVVTMPQTITPFSHTVLDDLDAPAWKATLGIVASPAINSWPIGSVFIAVVATNPNTLLGGGTWAAFGAGRVMVGLDAAQAEFDVVEEIGGAKTHTLSTAEIPSHTHSYPKPDTSVAGETAGGSATLNNGNATGATGGGGAHNNLQPYIVCYFWKRTA